MPLSFTGRKRIRKDFGQIGSATPMPNLIQVQKASWDAFLQFIDLIDEIAETTQELEIPSSEHEKY